VLPVLALLFIVVPILELAVIVQAGQTFGIAPTLAVLVFMSVAGAWLMKREGLGVVRRVQEQLDVGRVPAREVVDGFLILLGGALMLTPGFLSDILGMALLIPPVRAVVRRVVARRMQVRVLGAGGAAAATWVGGAWGNAEGGRGTYDARVTDTGTTSDPYRGRDPLEP
jgi:UPF0716 protein FxsA